MVSRSARRLRWRISAALIALVALLAAIAAAGWAPPLEDAASDLFGPVQREVRQWGEPISNLISNLEEYGRLEGENRSLRRRIEQLEARYARLREEQLRAPGRQAIQSVIEGSSAQLLAANVVTRDLTGLRTVIGIDRGANQGLIAGMPAIAAGGTLVGIVAEVRANTSFVRLVTDPDSAVRVLHQNSRAEVVAFGDTLGNLSADVPWSAEVELGHAFVTSGLDGVIPYGLPVGRVIAAEGSDRQPFEQVQLEPFAPLDQLEQVLIDLGTGGRIAGAAEDPPEAPDPGAAE